MIWNAISNEWWMRCVGMMSCADFQYVTFRWKLAEWRMHLIFGLLSTSPPCYWNVQLWLNGRPIQPNVEVTSCCCSVDCFQLSALPASVALPIQPRCVVPARLAKNRKSLGGGPGPKIRAKERQQVRVEFVHPSPVRLHFRRHSELYPKRFQTSCWTTCC